MHDLISPCINTYIKFTLEWTENRKHTLFYKVLNPENSDKLNAKIVIVLLFSPRGVAGIVSPSTLDCNNNNLIARIPTRRKSQIRTIINKMSKTSDVIIIITRLKYRLHAVSVP